MLNHSRRDVWEAVFHDQKPRHRQTVVGLLFTKSEQLILVQPTRANFGAYVLPQGGIRDGESIARALVREMEEEEFDGLEINRRSIQYLGECENKLPRWRKEQDKWLYFVAASLEQAPTGIHNFEENNFYCPVRESRELLPTIMEARPEKQRMIIDAVNAAHQCGFISWSAQLQFAA